MPPYRTASPGCQPPAAASPVSTEPTRPDDALRTKNPTRPALSPAAHLSQFSPHALRLPPPRHAHALAPPLCPVTRAPSLRAHPTRTRTGEHPHSPAPGDPSRRAPRAFGGSTDTPIASAHAFPGRSALVAAELREPLISPARSRPIHPVEDPSRSALPALSRAPPRPSLPPRQSPEHARGRTRQSSTRSARPRTSTSQTRIPGSLLYTGRRARAPLTDTLGPRYTTRAVPRLLLQPSPDQT